MKSVIIYPTVPRLGDWTWQELLHPDSKITEDDPLSMMIASELTRRRAMIQDIML